MNFDSNASSSFRTAFAAMAVILGAGIGAANAAPVDLSGWIAEGGGNWNLESGDNAVLQTINGAPTVFHNGVNSQNQALSGTIEVQTTFDDDFIGFVLGFQSGELSSGSADFILIDWKQNTQSGAAGGLALSRVTGSLAATGSGIGSDAWDHDGVVTELARATNLGNVGWADNTEYTFDLNFSAGLIQVFVDGSLELNVTGSFGDGAFGFYNHSQQSVRYAGIEEDVFVADAPATAAIFALAALGLIARRRRA